MKKFQRKIEDFVCENCGSKVKGNGYTNHCPYCLWSKHVDINPGDRQEICKGLMKPINILMESDNFIIVQKCEKCGIERKIKADESDEIRKNIDNIL